MKIILSIWLSLITIISFSQSRKPDSNFHVFLLIGQSNMAGRGPIDSESQKTIPQIWALDKNNQWQPAKDPLHFDKPSVAGVGPGISFAKEMIDNDTNVRIGLVPCAVGGSPIEVWEPGAIYQGNFHPYDDALRRAKLAIQQGVLKGILWHQGESNNDSLHSALYMEKLQKLITRLRTDLQDADLPFVVGEIGYFNKENYINSIIHQLPGKVGFTAVVSARNLTDKGDHLHFDTHSARELGRRYAIAMKALLEKEKR